MQDSGPRKPGQNGKKPPRVIAVPSPSASEEDEEEQDQLDHEEEEEQAPEEESSSSEADDGGSDFEDASPRKSKAVIQKKPRKSRAIDRIPVIKPRKSGTTLKAPKTPKVPKVSKAGASNRAKVARAPARVKHRLVEDLDESEGQSELYGNVIDADDPNCLIKALQ